MKEMGEEAHLEQKTTENEANEKMRGLRKVASTEMERRMRNIGKDQELRGASKDLMRQKVVKAQFFRGVVNVIKAIGKAIGRGLKRVVKSIPKKTPKVRDLPGVDLPSEVGGGEPNEATNILKKDM